MYWCSASTSPPGLNDVAIAENLAIEMHLKAIQEIAGEVVTEPTLEEFAGLTMETRWHQHQSLRCTELEVQY